MVSIIIGAAVAIGMGVAGYMWMNRRSNRTGRPAPLDSVFDVRLAGDAAENWAAEVQGGTDGDAD
jgi:hypothetical protein